MDDFSWGTTRLIQGESGKKIVVLDEGKFDLSEIPLKRWREYEEELWERGSNQSIGEILEAKSKAEGQSREGSIYGRESMFNQSFHGVPQSRNDSRSPSRLNQSFRPGTSLSYQMGTPFDQRSEFGGIAQSSYSGFGGAMGGVEPNQTQIYPNPSARSSAFFGNGNSGVTSARNSVFGGSIHNRGAGGQGAFDGAKSESIMMMDRDGQHSISGGGGFSRPMSLMNSGSYFGGDFKGSPGGGSPGGLPSDAVISGDIRSILATADLNTITKKGVRTQLEIRYGVELGDRKDWVNKEVEKALGY